MDKMKSNYTFNITSKGETFDETQYGYTEKMMLEMKSTMEMLNIKVNRIYIYDLGGISTKRKLIYSKSKGWL